VVIPSAIKICGAKLIDVSFARFDRAVEERIVRKGIGGAFAAQFWQSAVTGNRLPCFSLRGLVFPAANVEASMGTLAGSRP